MAAGPHYIMPWPALPGQRDYLAPRLIPESLWATTLRKSKIILFRQTSILSSLFA
jgi:hypothetical protein